MIRFYYNGGSTAVKEALTAQIKEDLDAGKQVLLLVPEQETVSAERRMLEALPPSAQLRFEVVNFSRLANRVFRILGGHSWNTATPAVRALLMWRTLRHLSPLLLQYGTHASEPKLCDMMLEAATRLRAYCIPAEKLLQTADELPENDPLRPKLQDLGTVLGTFEADLIRRFDNGDDDLDRLAAILQGNGAALFESTHIYLDSFTDYTGQEIAVLRRLMAASPCVSFTLPLESPHDTGLHLSSAARTHEQLKRIANELGIEIKLCLTPSPTPQHAQAYLAKNLFRMTAEAAPMGLVQGGNVRLTECNDPFSEADAAVSYVQELVRNGCRYRDIAIVLRDASARVGILDAALEREGIPFFLSEKTDITLRPLVKLILLALRIHLHGWRDEDVVSYLKTGLCGICPDDVNLFEEYTSVWHPRGARSYETSFERNPDGYTTTVSARARQILEGANRARACLVPPLQALFKSLESEQAATEKCRALYAFLESLHIREQLKAQAAASLSAGERREAEELSRLYTVTVEALEAVASALEDEPLTVAQFSEALRLVFARTDIGTIPTSVDEVTIGSAAMLRTDHPRFVLVLGLNEGEFPRTVGNDGLIAESEKERLRAFGLELPSDRTERASDELFYVYRAFCAPREGLYLSYTKATVSGSTASPSFAISRVRTLLKELPTHRFESEPPLEHIYTPSGALDRFGELDSEEKAAVCDLLSQMQLPAAKTLSLPVVEPRASVTLKTAEEIFEKKELSPSHLESFSSCKFAYYCEKILRLREEKSGSLELSDTGTFLHYVLEQVMQTVKQEKRPVAEWDEARRDDLVARICAAYIRDLEAASGSLTPRASALMKRLSTLAALVVTSLFEELSDSDFVPALTEFDLRGADPQGTLTLPGAPEIPLTGKADRVDLWRAPTGEAYLRVVDYKTGTRKFSPKDVEHGFSLQMPLYLSALCSRTFPFLNQLLGLPAGTKLRPAGVTYFSSAVSSENTPSRVETKTALSNAAGRLVRSGVLLEDGAVMAAATHSGNTAILGTKKSKKTLSEAEFEEMFHSLEQTVSRINAEMKGGFAAAKPNNHGNRKPCDYCRFAAICRTAKIHPKGDTEDA